MHKHAIYTYTHLQACTRACLLHVHTAYGIRHGIPHTYAYLIRRLHARERLHLPHTHTHASYVSCMQVICLVHASRCAMKYVCDTSICVYMYACHIRPRVHGASDELTSSRPCCHKDMLCQILVATHFDRACLMTHFAYHRARLLTH
jgi:hypothetical protein